MRLVAGGVVACVAGLGWVFPAGEKVQTVAPDRWTTEAIASASASDVARAVKENLAEAHAIAAGLERVCADPKRDGELRKVAGLLLESAPSDLATTICLRNLSVRVVVATRGDVDLAESRPFRHVLSQLEWRALPGIIAFLSERREEPVLEDLAAAIRAMPAREAMLRVMAEGAESAGAAILKENVERIRRLLQRG